MKDISVLENGLIDMLSTYSADEWDECRDRFIILTELEDFKILKEAIEEAPTVEDVVQVVMCKDCEYGEETDEDTGNDYLCRFNGSDWNGGEHFCSYGKRRGEGE